MATDVLVLSINRPSPTMVLNIQDIWFFIFHEDWFQPPVLPQFWEVIENVPLCFLNLIQHNKDVPGQSNYLITHTSDT